MQPTFEQMSPHVWFDVDDFTQGQPPTFTIDPQKILFIVQSPILSNGKIHLYKLVLLAYCTCSPIISSEHSISSFWEINALLKPFGILNCCFVCVCYCFLN